MHSCGHRLNAHLPIINFLFFGDPMQEILLNIESKEIRYAVLKNGTLYDLIIERKKNRQLTGNIYRGRVTNILHNIQSAFIDINEGENGFIHISDILENTQKFQEMFEMDFDWDVRYFQSASAPTQRIGHLEDPENRPAGACASRQRADRNKRSPAHFQHLYPGPLSRSYSRTLPTAASRAKSKMPLPAIG